MGNTKILKFAWRSAPVYPRWRGEHGAREPWALAIPGLSPLAWGTLIQRGERRRVGRFIPAGVGNTCEEDRDFPGVPVYPRWRGEHRFTSASVPPCAGLSPLAWGTRQSGPAPAPASRFIPAGVGNTVPSLAATTLSAVYPRWRGEHAIRSRVASSSGGLSPLAWGTLKLNPFP